MHFLSLIYEINFFNSFLFLPYLYFLRFSVERVWEPVDMLPEEVSEKIEEISALCIDYSDASFELPQDALDSMYSLIKHFDQLSDQSKELLTTMLNEKTTYLLDFIFQKIQKGADAITQTQFNQEFKNNVKIMLYFFCCATAHIETVCATSVVPGLDAAAKKAAKGKKTAKKSAEDEEFSWSSIRIVFLQTIKRLLTVPANLLWSMSIIQENFLTGIWSYAVKLLEERPVGIAGTGSAEGAARAICKEIVAKCVSSFGNTNVSGSFTSLTSALLEAINRAEHMATFAAEICSKCSASLTAEFLREISAMEFSSQSAAQGMKNVGQFIEDLVKYNSQIMIANLPVILHQLDAGAHQIRSSLLHALGEMVLKVDVQIKTLGMGVELDVSAVKPATHDGPEDPEFTCDTQEETEVTTRNTSETQKSMLPRVRDQILDMIVERTHDVSPYTRATVLKVWHTLLAADAIPVRRFASVTELAFDRLHDKAAAVRKAAVSLLAVLMDHNPYGSTLDHLVFTQQKVLMESKLIERLTQLKTVYLASQLPVTMNTDISDTSAVGTMATPDEPEEEEEFDMDAFQLTPDVMDDSETQGLKKGIEYCLSALDMINTLVKATPKVEAMLKSKSSLEVVEAIKFIARTVNFNIRGSLKSFTGALPLVFHTEASIREACISSFKNVFLVNGDTEAEGSTVLPAAEVAKSLCHLLRTFGPDERTSIEEIIRELFAKNEMDNNITTELWRIVTEAENAPIDAFEASHKSQTDIGIALSILTMIARNGASASTMQTKAHLAVHHGLSKRVFSTLDFSAMKSTAMFLQECEPFLTVEMKNTSISTEPKRKLFEETTKKLVGVILGGMCEDDEAFTRAWFPACEEAVHALYHLHPSADAILGTVVTSMYAAFAMPRTEGMQSQVLCSNARFARFLFVLGQVALNTLVFADKLATQAKKVVLQRTRDDAAKQRTLHDVSANEDDAEMTAQVDADHDNCFHYTMEQSLVMNNLLGQFHGMVALVVANQNGQFSHPLLRETSVLALCKFMCVSSILCEKYLPLLFTALERETIESCRTSIMLAFGDLMLRFPNSLEAWTPLMYARLSDDKIVVRYNALMVLTHLILNDMVKVKGQVAHVVMCLSDAEVKIRDLAQVFFVKLSERSNNPVYNLLGDIISVLSREKESTSSGEGVVQVATVTSDSLNYPSRDLTAKEFQTTMHFMLSFVKKDKQADSMLERLLVRLSTAQSLRQRRSLAYCISELSVSDKGIKKIVEMLRTIKDALYDEEVFEYVLKTVRNAKKEGTRVASSDDKKIIEELEKALMAIARDARGEEAEKEAIQQQNGEECGELINHGENENKIPTSEQDKAEFSLKEASKPAAKSKNKVSKTPVKKAKTARKPKKKAANSDDDGDDDGAEEEEEADFSDMPVTKTHKTTSRRRALAEVN